MYGERIRVRGVVQGVGFRPVVWRIAQELNINGSVRNDGGGVLIDVWAAKPDIDQLVLLLSKRLPPLAQIDSIQRQILTRKPERAAFEIIASNGSTIETAVVADSATCPACLEEINHPNNRRYRYPFTNCTHCGPRFSIIKAMPYDRVNTSMAAFKMCPACQSEYDNPADRRFHAQANACPQCGPHIWLQDSSGQFPDCHDVIEYTAHLIQAGKIVAIKSIGGFHLACDAANEETVTRLRQRKQRAHKPFALLASNEEMIKRHACLSSQEQQWLKSAAAPIVLLTAKGTALAPSVAPGHHRLGFALPSTPLHHLLMQSLKNPIVLTSGNVNNQPQCIANEEAIAKLADIADAFLLHNREIVNRVDDSVIRLSGTTPTRLRNARGYSPTTIRLPPGFENTPNMLAMGATLKNSFCLTLSDHAIVSQHIGDLENTAVQRDYRHQLELYQTLYRHQAEEIVVDKHPGYFSSQLGHELAQKRDLKYTEVQHHHAHVAAVMAEHNLPFNTKPVLGVALDGLGMGENGELWGGEFMMTDYQSYKRLASFEPVALLGASQAMREPWRNTLAHLLRYFDWNSLVTKYAELELIQYLQTKPVNILQQMQKRHVNSPCSSSAGRLFDAVAAALGLCREGISYEGQAAMELEALASATETANAGYSIDVNTKNDISTLSWALLWTSLLGDLQNSVSRNDIAIRFHGGLIQAITRLTVQLCHSQRLTTVALTGGVFQNALLLRGVENGLTQQGIKVITAQQLPMGDGGISFGQAMVAIAQSKAKEGKV